MTNRNSGNIPISSHEQHWPTTVAALAVGTAFFSLWFWLLPQWLGFQVELAGTAHWRWLAALPSVLGFAVALRCVWDFGWTGHGTPAPIAPPRVRDDFVETRGCRGQPTKKIDASYRASEAIKLSDCTLKI